MTRDEAHDNVVKAFKDYDEAGRAAEEQFLKAKEMRAATEEAGKRLDAAIGELQRMLRQEAGLD